MGREDLDPVAVLLEQHKTTWPFVRVVPEIKQDGTIVYRIEFRPMDTQPTNKDQMSVATTVLGLLDGLKQYLADRRISFAVDVPAEEINKRLDYNKHRYHNYLKGCCRGLDACFDWFDGERVLLRDILKGMINSAEAGLQSRGISDVSYGPYLETIKRRLYSGGNGKMGGTPADLMKLLWAGHYNGDPAETAKYLNQYLADVHIIGLETGLDFLQIWDKHNPLKRPRIFA